MSKRLGSVELRHLVALSAIARLGSFSAAADELGYTQSAVSQQLARLERIVGQRLIERPGGPRPVTLTAAGAVLLRHADAITAQLNSVAADLDAFSSGTSGSLRVGCYHSAGARILPRLLRAFLQSYPQVQVLPYEDEDDGELLRMVEHGELDLTFMVFPLPTGPFAAIELLDDPYVLVQAAGSDRTHTENPIPLDELATMPLISHAKMRDVHLIEHRLGRPLLGEHIVFRSNDNATVLGMVAEEVGAAVIPWLAVDPDRHGLHLRRIADVSPRKIGIAWHRDRYPLPTATAFSRLAREVCQHQKELLARELR